LGVAKPTKAPSWRRDCTQGWQFDICKLHENWECASSMQ